MATNLDDPRTGLFTPRERLSIFEINLGAIGHCFNREGFALSESDFDDMRLLELSLMTMATGHFEVIRHLASVRRKNLEVGGHPVYISMGEDCFEKIILIQRGMKRPAILGGRSTPVDLAVHPTASNAELLETDFAGYFDRQNLEFDVDRDMCLNTRFRVFFNHDVGDRLAVRADSDQSGS